MKTFITLFALLIFSYSNAQDSKVCKEIVSKVVTAFNTKAPQNISKHLATDFVFFGQKGEMAKLIFPEFFKQMDDKITKYSLKSETKKGTLTLIYDVVYNDRGKDKAIFVFNKKNQIVNMELFKSEVQTIKQKIKLNNFQ